MPVNGFGDGTQSNLTITLLPGDSFTGTNDGMFLNDANTVINQGTITGQGNDGIEAQGSVDVTNTNPGDISGAFTGIASNNSSVTLDNSGTVEASAGDAVFAQTISTVTNSGSITTTDSFSNAIEGGDQVIIVSNSGLISGGGGGVTAGNLAQINNGASGTITAGSTAIGVFNVPGSTAMVTNAGTISSTGANSDAIVADIVNIVSNSGTITGDSAAIAAFSTANVTNSGTITGASTSGISTAIQANTSITLINSSSGVIHTTGSNAFNSAINTSAVDVTNAGLISSVTGILAANGGVSSVFNSGTVTGTGGTAIRFFHTGSTLTLGPGSVINGNVLGSGSDIFQLGGIGTDSFNAGAIGVQYQGFTTFNKVGTSTWTLTGTGSNQAWNVNAGTLVAGHQTAGTIDALGTGAITMKGGALRSTVTGTFNNNLIFNDNTSSTVSATTGQTVTFGPNGGASFITLGDNSIATFGSPTDTGTVVISSGFNNIFATAQIVVAGGTLRDGNGILGNASSFIASTTVNAGATLDMNDQTDAIHILLGAGTVITGTNPASTLFLLNGDEITGDFSSHLFSGVITGPGSVEVGPVGPGGGETILTGTNTYAGGTVIQDGAILQLGNGGASGSILGNVAFTTPNSLPLGQLIFNRSDAYQFGGIISGPGTVTQAGSGTTTLSGTSTYAGPTTINAGTLQVDGSITSAVTVNSGGTLGGNGTTGAVDVASGGTLAPGASAGILTTGNLSFAAGATFAVELGGPTPGVGGFDQVIVNGSVALNNATLSLSVLGGFNPASGTFVIIDNHGTDLTGTFLGLAEGATITAAPGNTYTISYAGTGGDRFVALTALNDPPVVDLNGAGAGTGTTLAYTENAAATAIAPSGVTTDDSANFNGGSLTVHFSANGATEDQLSILTTGGVTVAAGVVSVGGNAVGNVSGGVNGADLVVSFNTNNATPAAISTLLEHIGYADNSNDPSTLARSVNFTLVDGGGGTDTGSATATINVTAVNDPPVLNNVPAAADYTENATPVTLSAAFPNEIFVTDPDPVPHGAPGGNGLALSATVKIASGFVAGDELLVFDTTTTTSATSGFYTGINIQWDYDATTHILTMFSADPPTNSGDTLVDFAHVLDNVQFASTSDDPANGGVNNTRTLQWQIQDAGGTANGGNDLSAIYTTTLTIHPTNDAPVAAITPTSYSATEQTALSLKNNGIAVSDVDGGAGSETVTLSVGEGVLNVTAGGSGATVNNSGTGTVTITGTAAQINALLNTDSISTVSYIDNTDTPGASTTLTLLIHDNGNTGTGGDLSSSDTATINITAVNDVPVLTGFGDVSSFTENGSSVLLDTNQNSTVSDPELNVSLNNYAGATLTIARHGGANADDAFAGTGTLDLVDVNGIGENVSLDGGATFIGTFTNPGDGSVSFTFNANAHAADIASVMRQIVYGNASDNPPASLQVDFTFSDGNGDPSGQPQGTGPTPGTTVGSFTVNIAQIDDPPALSNVATAASYSIGSPGQVLSSGLQVFDPDAAPPSPNPGLVSATITITAGFLATDQLFVNLPVSGGHFLTDDDADPHTPSVVTNISVTSNSGGQLVLGGLDSVLHYQEVLDAVSYSSSAVDPTNGGADPTRTINWKISDGLLDNQAPTPPIYPETTLGFNSPPSVDLDGSTAGNNYVTTFTENGAPIPVANANVSITDTDDSSISSATIVLTNAKAGDALSISGALPGGISSSIDNSVAGQITVNLFDSATLADYQTALGQIRFVNTSDLPNTTDRDITVEVANSGTSNIAHATVHVVAVNDAPVNTVPGPQSINEDTNLAIAGLAVSDVDAGAGTLTTTLSVAHGALAIGTVGGGAAVSGGGTGPSLTLTGTLAQINTTLSAAGNVLYRGTQDFNGGDTLTVVTNDNGNTGTGGALSDTDTVAITVNAVNDPPVFAHFGATHTSATEQTFTLLNGAATVSDVELDAANGGAGNYAGASLIIGRGGSPISNPEDTFFFGGGGAAFTVDTVNHVLLAGGQQFATYNIPSSGSLAGTIAVNFNSLTTPATSALVNNVLQHITYENLSDTPPASVTMHYTFHDGNTGAQGSGGDGVDAANRIVDITAVNDPPVLAGVAAHVVLPPGGGALILSPGLTVSDVDSATLASATVHVSAGTFAGDGDVLAVSAGGLSGTSISASYNAATETLTLAGTDTLAHYQQALDHVTLQTTIGNPSNGGLDPARTVDWQVNDGSAANNLSNIASTTVDVPKSLPQNDFNGDGHSDILWQNNDGTPAIWLLNGSSLISGANVGFNPDAGQGGGGLATLPWHEVGSGDFNGDGKSEILWQNKDGTVAEWIVNGTSLVSGGNVAFNPGSSWHAIGTGDFNGDGKADIVWQNDTGQTAVWLMDGLNILSGADVGVTVGTRWHIIDTGDFNGDGKSDILWQNDDGQAALWLMNGTSRIVGDNVGINPGSSWKVQSAGDFNGDGKADILWQNDSGQPAVWLMDGYNLISGANVGLNPGANWQVHAAADFNGDGKADILWQNVDGTPAVWLMNGQSLINGANVATDPGTPWHIIPLHHDLLV